MYMVEVEVEVEVDRYKNREDGKKGGRGFKKGHMHITTRVCLKVASMVL